MKGIRNEWNISIDEKKKKQKQKRGHEMDMIKTGSGDEYLLGADDFAVAEELAHVVAGRFVESHQCAKGLQGRVFTVDAAPLMRSVDYLHIADV